MKSLEATMGEPAVKCRRDSSNCILEKGKSIFDVRGVERCSAHEYVLVHL